MVSDNFNLVDAHLSLLELCKIDACRVVSILVEWVEHLYHINFLWYHVSEPDKYSKP